MEKKPSTGDKLMNCMKAPVRVLCKVRDLYVSSMNTCANNVNCSAYAPSALPRSFSTNSARSSTSGDEEAMRVGELAHRRLSIKGDNEVRRQKGRSKSLSAVAMGKIDENEPC